MKKLLIFLAFLITTACAAPSVEPDAPSPVATTVEPLQEDTPSPVVPTPSPTQLTAATLTATLPPEDNSQGSPQGSGQPVIIFHQEGGFAGVDLTWKIYDSGLIETPGGKERTVDPAVVDELLAAIEQEGFFDLVQTKPENVCCDFFTYTLSVIYGDKKNVITYNDGDPDIPLGLAEVVSTVQQLIPQ